MLEIGSGRALKGHKITSFQQDRRQDGHSIEMSFIINTLRLVLEVNGKFVSETEPAMPFVVNRIRFCSVTA